jgi:hypothetical protein
MLLDFTLHYQQDFDKADDRINGLVQPGSLCIPSMAYFWRMIMNEFYVWIEQDEDGMYVGEVPQLPACYTQGRTLDELLCNIREVQQFQI